MSEPITEGWVDTRTAAELTGYTAAYMRQLALGDKIVARKVGRDWLIERASLLAYKARMERLGTEKHNPWRPGLAQGRKAESE